MHGLVPTLDGIDFARRQLIGIRAYLGYKAEIGPDRDPPHSAQRDPCTSSRPAPPGPAISRKLKFTLPGPMIADTIADEHYRDRPALADAFAAA